MVSGSQKDGDRKLFLNITDFTHSFIVLVTPYSAYEWKRSLKNCYLTIQLGYHFHTLNEVIVVWNKLLKEVNYPPKKKNQKGTMY